MVDPTSECYQRLISALQVVVDEATDPKFKANRQRRLEKMKAKREAALMSQEFMPYTPSTTDSTQDVILLALRQILLNQQTLLLASGHGECYQKANDSGDLAKQIGEHLLERSRG